MRHIYKLISSDNIQSVWHRRRNIPSPAAKGKSAVENFGFSTVLSFCREGCSGIACRHST